LTEIVQARKLMGAYGARLKAIFVTVDPERDTSPVLKTYIQFRSRLRSVAARPGQLEQVAKEFKLHIRMNPGHHLVHDGPYGGQLRQRPAVADCGCMRGMALGAEASGRRCQAAFWVEA
jgi:cytochrome oxidase Cu insertion factor (SCO1/SenC/PrrC family)